MNKYNFLYIATLFCLSWDAFAECQFLPGHGQSAIQFNIPSTLSAPRDAPDGTIPYESPIKTLQNVYSSFKCDTSFVEGIKNSVGPTTANGKIFPIGNTGIAWQWVSSFSPSGFPGLTRPPTAGMGFNGTTHGLRLIKNGSIQNSKINPGVLGILHEGSVAPLRMEIIGTGTSISPQSCETPDTTVQMGNYTLRELGYEQGSTTKPVPFSIKLNNCPSGINTVKYRFKKASQIYDYQNGVIRLSSDSTAKGLGVQIKDADNRPILIDDNTRQTFNDYDSKGGNFEIPLTAAYFRIKNEGQDFQAGTANAELIFTIEYL
ncbi:fimbrial protein [Pseudomonas sp. EMN2]|uniref:fimbrial protein n=1 Tax=Pseudomonas sp. EMN2 TaxID=2615212 RepID=UPI00129BCE6A|nr:fimbrial protein [Pseudomonas sp. EMN2]